MSNNNLVHTYTGADGNSVEDNATSPSGRNRVAPTNMDTTI